MPLDPNRWTLKTQEAVTGASDLARKRSHPEVTPDHLLAALLGQEDGVVLPTLQKAGVAPASLRNRVEDALGKIPRAYGTSDPRLGREVSDVINRAEQEREGLRDDYLSTEHLLLAMADRVGLTHDQLLAVLREVRGSHRVTSQTPEG